MATKFNFKLLYVGSFSTEALRKLRELFRHFCVDLDISLAFFLLQIRIVFRMKEEIHKDVMPTTSGKHSDTFQRAFVSIWEGTGLLTFSNISYTLRNVKDSVLRAASPF